MCIRYTHNVKDFGMHARNLAIYCIFVRVYIGGCEGKAIAVHIATGWEGFTRKWLESFKFPRLTG